MNFNIMTLFPDMFDSFKNTSIIGRAINDGLISVNTIDFRQYADNKYMHVDDYPYGGGAGMVIQPHPVVECFRDITKDMDKKPRVIYMTPQGKVFKQEDAIGLAKEENLIFLCGHYEGIDERALELIVTDYYSIGDYVLTGGELPSMVMIDAIARNIDGVLNNKASTEFESFCDNLLEYPQYTRPPVYEGMEVPEVLLSGHHANIEKWRREKSIERTLERRPDLLDDANLSKKEIEYLNKLKNNRN
ncbi:tRNA (guanosine(37)-N1)-methyltransferase TrmD [uncultured Eubacterium sp.]|uniref:tRNA (guanosine(37)-N1)-methyltransferase TrmD n=1 Tax=uncultured Eubacterium sp. TaxID=165185 RepID=UPI002599A0B8|nr:tRNA (guanosine(37)-N1)-methyltransferase TrmD [uncultured Eubacterium sp.]